MRRTIIALTSVCLLMSLAVSGQNWGVGFRLGDPSGITLKKYGDGHAWELSMGRTHLFRTSNYYNDRYDHWYVDQHFNHKEHQLIGYKASVALGLQLHYLWQRPIGTVKGFEWYFGVGGQLRLQDYRYDYRYKEENGPDWIVVYDQRVTELDLGADGVIGLEYTFSKVPISLFLDGTLFMEIFDDPFLFRPQAGTGARFRF
ncbi:MAG: hypothetical protein IPO17_16585 [Flavobacteriales bacterium]|nr:hypothetical protein [Flavobacteriales bacterium]